MLKDKITQVGWEVLPNLLPQETDDCLREHA